jgi:hypothetical protein
VENKKKTCVRREPKCGAKKKKKGTADNNKKALAENDTSVCGKRETTIAAAMVGKRKRDKNLLTQHRKCKGGKRGNEESKRENCPALRCVSASKGERGATRGAEEFGDSLCGARLVMRQTASERVALIVRAYTYCGIFNATRSRRRPRSARFHRRPRSTRNLWRSRLQWLI